MAQQNQQLVRKDETIMQIGATVATELHIPMLTLPFLESPW